MPWTPESPRLSAEERLRRKRLSSKRWNAEVRKYWPNIDEGFDPMPTAQRGENRLLFNLGDGSRRVLRHRTRTL